MISLFFLAVSLLLVENVLAYPSGPGTCSALATSVSAMPLSLNDQTLGFSLSLSSSVYTVGQSAGVVVTIWGSKNTNYTGLLLYAEDANGNKVGTFSNFNKNYFRNGAAPSVSACLNSPSVVGHTSAVSKDTSNGPTGGFSFTWSGLNLNTPSVTFRAAIMTPLLTTAPFQVLASTLNGIQGPSSFTASSSAGAGPGSFSAPVAGPIPNSQVVTLTLSNTPNQQFPLLLPVLLPFPVATNNLQITSVQVLSGCNDATCSSPSSTTYWCIDGATCNNIANPGQWILNLGTPTTPVVRSAFVYSNANGAYTYFVDVVVYGGPRLSGSVSVTSGSPTIAYSSGLTDSLAYGSPSSASLSVTITYPLSRPQMVGVSFPFTKSGNFVASSAVLNINCADSTCSSSDSKVYLCVDVPSCATVSVYNYFTVTTPGGTGSQRNALVLTGTNGWVNTYYVDIVA